MVEAVEGWCVDDVLHERDSVHQPVRHKFEVTMTDGIETIEPDQVRVEHGPRRVSTGPKIDEMRSE